MVENDQVKITAGQRSTAGNASAHSHCHHEMTAENSELKPEFMARCNKHVRGKEGVGDRGHVTPFVLLVHPLTGAKKLSVI